MATIPEALAIAVQHHQGGRLQTAEQIYRQILAVEPNQVDAIHLLGVIAHQAGKHEVAVEYIGRAIGLKADAAPFHNNLGEAYRALRRTSAAVACYRRALELNPDFAEAHNNLGIALNGQGNLEAAVACCRRALELNPLYAEAHNNLAVALKEQGRLDEAVACCRRALELKPGYAEAHNNLGFALKEQGRLDEAVACYRRALELKPDFAEGYNNLGGVLEAMGDLHGAEDSFRAALRHNPRFAAAHFNLAALLGGKLSEEDLAAQRRLLAEGSASGEQGGLTDAERSYLHFGLACVLDARDEYAEAAKHLERGNALRLSEHRKRGQGYDPKEYEFLVARMIEACGPDFFERMRGFGSESELPVFVVGLPRSGTTLIEQVLASHSRIFGAGGDQTGPADHGRARRQGADPIEGLPRLDRPTARRLASRHLEGLRVLSPAALRIVDKCRRTTCIWGSWRAFSRGRNSSTAAATCATWPSPAGKRISGKFAGPTTRGTSPRDFTSTNG